MRLGLPLGVFAVMATSALAAPVAPDIYGFSDDLMQFYSEVSRHINELPPDANPTCDVTEALLPSQASQLPTVPAGQELRHVAIGRGTQNYTCSDSSSNTKPVAAGALATLFDASCIAANYPDLISILIKVMLNCRFPFSFAVAPPADLPVLGHHYFSDMTTPVFDLDTSQHQNGIAITKKVAQMSAPKDSIVGQGGQGDGAVAWLYLDTVSGTTGGYKAVYRVNTAGGQPPTTCHGMPGSFEIPYSAAYYFYGS